MGLLCSTSIVLHLLKPPYSFLAASKLKAREEISAAVHRALIEIYTLREANMPLAVMSSWGEDLPELSGITFSAQDADGRVALNFTNEAQRETVLKSTSRVESKEELPVYTEEGVLETIEQQNQQPSIDQDAGVVESQSIRSSDVEVDPVMEVHKPSLLEAASKDTSWRSIQFDDPDLKFAVCTHASESN